MAPADDLGSMLRARLLDSLPAAVVLVDDSGTVTYLNRRAEEVYLYSSAEWQGRSVTEMDLGGEAPDDLRSIFDHVARGSSWQGDRELHRSDGTVVAARVHVDPWVDEASGFTGFICTSLEIKPDGPQLDASSAELAAALAAGQIEVWYQPQMSLTDPGLVGFEALVRWRHPERGLLLPPHFLPIAERSGLLVSLGRLVMRQAALSAAVWREVLPHRPPAIAVNLSATELGQPDLVESVQAALLEADLPPELLCLEITEGMLTPEADAAIERLAQLRSMGVSVAVDDFGTGYSSLRRLKRFPVSLLKIDQSFVAGLEDDPDDEVIVSAVVNLAHTLGLGVVAEGVETPGQFQKLQTLGCDYAQGYFWEPALAADDVIDRLEPPPDQQSLDQQSLDQQLPDQQLPD